MSTPPSVALSIRLDHELSRLEGEIRWYEEEALKGAKLTVLHKIEVGKRLLDAKRLLSGPGVPQGEFGRWAQSRLGWSRMHIARHMRLARADVTRVLHRLTGAQSMRAALAALKDESAAQRSGASHPEGTPAVIRYRVSGEVELPAADRSVADLVAACTEAEAWRLVRSEVVATVEDQPEPEEVAA